MFSLKVQLRLFLLLLGIFSTVLNSDGKDVVENGVSGESSSSTGPKGHNIDPTDPFSWSKSYMDEFEHQYFHLSGVEDSLDQRHANFILAQELYQPMDNDINKYRTSSGTLEDYNKYINGPEVDQELCSSQLRQMVDLLDELAHINRQRSRANVSQIGHLTPEGPTIGTEHIHLARIMDSYGRYESGTLSGRSRMFGHSEQCLETPLLLGKGTNQQVVRTRVCSIKLRVHPHLDTRMLPLLERANPLVELAICLPNTCHSNSLSNNKHLIQQLVDSQFQMPTSIYADKHREVEDLFCLNDWNEPMLGIPTSGKVLIGLTCVWTLIMLIVTWNADALRSNGNSKLIALVDGMDLKLHMSNLVGLNEDRGKKLSSRIDLDTLNIIKITFIFAAIYGHTIMFRIFTSSDLIHVFSSIHKTSFVASFFNRTLAIDTLFVVTGLLITFMTLKKIDTSPSSERLYSPVPFTATCFMIGFARYLRLIPVLAVAFWYKKSIWIYLGSGLTWSKIFNEKTLYGACKQEPWYSPFTMLPTQLPIVAQCFPQVWSVVCDTRFAILAAPLILMLRKMPKLVISIALILTVWSTFMMYQAAFSLKPEYLALLRRLKGDALANFGTSSYLYTTFEYRFGGFFIGLIAGYITFMYYKAQIKQWPVWFKTHATRAAVLLVVGSELFPLVYPVLYRNVFPLVEPIRPHIAQTFFVNLRPIWAVANAIIMLRMITDWKDSTFFKLTNGNLLRMVCKVMYSVALVHFDVIIYFSTQGVEAVDRFSVSQALTVGSCSLVVSFVIGTIFYLVIESPLNTFSERLLTKLANLAMKEKTD